MKAFAQYRIYRAVIRAVKEKRVEYFSTLYYSPSYMTFNIKDSTISVELWVNYKSVDIKDNGLKVVDKQVSWGLRRAIRRNYPETYRKFFRKETESLHTSGLVKRKRNKKEVSDA